MSDLKATYLITAQQGMDFTRASAVRYLRAMAEGLTRRAIENKLTYGQATGSSALWTRDAGVLVAAALDLEQRLDLDPGRLRELGVTT